jgi:hypothetical protein
VGDAVGTSVGDGVGAAVGNAVGAAVNKRHSCRRCGARQPALHQ